MLEDLSWEPVERDEIRDPKLAFFVNALDYIGVHDFVPREKQMTNIFLAVLWMNLEL